MIAWESVLLLLFAFCVFLFISFLGIGGYIGTVFSDICFGFFGGMAWLFPVLLFLAAVFCIASRGNHPAGAKFGGCALLYLCLCCFAALIEGEYGGVYSFGIFYARCASLKQGGGVTGGTICHFLVPALGRIGTGIVVFAFALIALVLITQRSFLQLLGSEGSRMVQSARQSSKRHRKEREEREEWDLFSERNDFIPEREAEPEVSPSARPVRKEPSQAAAGTTLRKDCSKVQQAERGEKERLTVPRRSVQAAGEEKTAVQKNASGRSSAKTSHSGGRQSGSRSVSRTGTGPERELDVSFMFSPSDETRKSRKYAEGVTRNTKIAAPRARTRAKAYEVPPGSLESEDFFQSLEGESFPLHLEEDPFPLHIEGIEAADETEGAEETEKEALQAGTRSPAREEPEIFHEPAESGKDSARQKAEEGHASVSQSAENGRKSAGRPAEAQPQKEEAGKQQEEQTPEGGRIRHNPRSSEKEIEEGIASVEAEAAAAAKAVRPEYVFPPLDLLHKGTAKTRRGQEAEIRQTAAKLQQTLDSFGVHVTVTNVSCGPSVTRYELLPEQGVKVSKIVSLADDIKLNLAASDIRIEAPIPGKSAVGIEVPNAEHSTVPLRDLLESDEFINHKSKLAFATGKDISGRVVVSDIAKMPHLLIAGATGSGKSVCINTLIMSILYKAKPDEVKLIMIDPKVVELSVYNGIPHLFIPVVTDPKKAAGALNWGVAEMTDRYAKFAEYGVRDLKGYNQKIETLKDAEGENKPEKLPQIVIIVDELADLMMVAPGEVEDSICRLAQLARAAGIHLVIATQRPSVNVITGLIKANMPSRIAFAVTSGVDSRTIIDMYGAEKLLGKGDMLFYPQGYQKPARVQGAFVSDEEVSDVVDFLRNQNSGVVYNADMEEQIAKVQQASGTSKSADDTDELFAEAGKFIIEKDKASIGMLQRVFKIGFNRAARIMDQLADAGVVGPEEGTKPRRILMTLEEFENYLQQQ